MHGVHQCWGTQVLAEIFRKRQWGTLSLDCRKVLGSNTPLGTSFVDFACSQLAQRTNRWF